MNDCPRFIVRRHTKHRSSQRYSYTWNRHRYPLRDIRACHGPSGPLFGGFARTLIGAWIGVLSLPIGDAAGRVRDHLYRDRQWSL